jgi:PAS domain S-box-containing protein
VKQSESATLTSDLQKLWRPVLVGITVVIITVFLWQGLKQQEQVQIDRNIKFAASSTSQEITTQIHTRILALERMAQRWELQKGTPQAEWEADAINYWQDYPGFKAIKLVDKSYRVRWIVPQKEKEALLKESVESDELSKTILDKAKAGREVLIRSTTLDQGSKGFFVYIPLFLDNSESQSENNFDGFIVGVFSTQPLLDTILNQDFTEHYSISIFDKKEEIYTNRGKYLNSHIKTQWSHQSKINLKNLTWQLKVSPTPAMLVEAESSLPTVVLGAGLLTSLLLALVVYLQGRSRQYAENLEERNIDLFREIKERELAQESLQQQVKYVEDLYNNAPCGYHSLDPEGVFVRINDTELKWLGYTRSELIGKKFTTLLTAESLLTFEQDFPTFKERGWLRDLELEIVCKNGTILPALINATAIKDAAGNFIMSRSTLLDLCERKTAEEAVRESEERFRGAFEYSSVGMALVSTPGRWLKVNHALCQMLGYSQEELLNTTFQAVTYPDDLGISQDYVHQILADEISSFQISKRYLHKLGHVVWALSSISLVRNTNGSPLYFVAQIQDITARKQAEEELHWREALLRSMANASPLAFYVEDERTNEVLYFNSYFCEIWGIECTQEELQQGKFNNSDNKKFQVAGCSDCKPTFSGLAVFRKVCKPPVLIEKQTVVEDEISLPQGRVLRRLSTQICDKQDKYFGRLYIFEDITNAKLAEVERRNLSTALKSAVEGISQLDSLGHYTYVNQAYADMLGYEPEEMLGMTGLATVYPEDQQKVVDAYQIMLVSGKAETEVRAIRRDGSTFDKQMVIVKATDPDPDQKYKDVAYYCFIKDISHRREVERLKDEFVSLVSHELRTPLTSIRGSLGLVANGVLQSKPEKAQRMVEIAVNNTDRLIRLINDILDIERIESGKVQMTKQICDVASLVTQSADVMRNMAEKSDITLHVTTVPAQIWADPDRIIQTLTNLLSNAIKFSEPKSTVWLSCEIPQFPIPNSQFPIPHSPLPIPHSPLLTPQILLKIKDQGRGIPADKLESIFERFQQVDASDSRSKGGTGLGLPICRSIVQHHDGEIWVESTLNEGATFYVALPLLPEKEVEAPVNKFNAPLILVCDDDPGVQTVLQGMLQQQGYRVICVASGQEALQEAQRQQPNVIFLNLMMPEMNGWETLAALKQESRTQDIPVIILSGLMPDAREIPNQQISNWIVKPPDEKLMFQALERVLSGQNQEVKVLVVEDDLDLAQVLIAMFERYGVKTYHATTGRQAIEMSQRLIPHLLVLDLALPEVSGYAVVDWLRQHNHLRQVPLVVYCAQDLSEGDRQRLNLGETLFLTKGRVTPEEFEERVIDLLRRMV